MAEHTHESLTLSQLEALCRDRGVRMTPHRRSVMAKLMEARRPMSAYDLLDVLRPEDKASTPASIYRSLDFLLQFGLVHRLETMRSFVACEHPDHHSHAVQFLICRQCGTVVEAEDSSVETATKALGTKLGFTLEQRTVELTGICATCQIAGPGVSPS